jgi:metallo-beta-lactamase family protein
VAVNVTFHGAARTVTGSMPLARSGGSAVLLDCGLYQGRRREADAINRELPFDPASIDAVVLSHAHIDHCGALPVLVRSGFAGSIFATPATRDLIAVMLMDAAMIQAADARYLNKRIDRGELESPRIEPLYTPDDVVETLKRVVGVPYRHQLAVARGVGCTFLDAGHVLGSAIVVLDLEEGGLRRRLAFSGDLGRADSPILHAPEVPRDVDALILESTYGDRRHPPRTDTETALADTIARTIARGGKVIIPTFALERAQELLLSLKTLRAQRRIPHVPIYLDSPLAIKVTDVFRLHPDCFDADARRTLRSPDSPFDIPGLAYVEDPERSKALCASTEPMIVLAGSGMCESGRVLHHLRTAIADPQSTVVIVGFQAVHTLGRRLVELRPKVRIFGVERERLCDVVSLAGLSAHADQGELVAFARAVARQGELTDIALVHGEPPAQRALAHELAHVLSARVHTPDRGDQLELGAGHG